MRPQCWVLLVQKEVCLTNCFSRDVLTRLGFLRIFVGDSSVADRVDDCRESAQHSMTS